MLVWPMINLGLAVIAAAAAMAVLAKVLPRTSLYHRLVLTETDPAGVVRGTTETQPAILLGKVGVAKTTLRPSGKADIDGRLEDVVSQGEFLAAGEPVRVVAVEGTRVVVERASV
jgi:membrane-bound serine protease (ClpP class)